MPPSAFDSESRSGTASLALALRVHRSGRMRVTTRWRLACRSPIAACRRFWWRGVWRLGHRSLAVWLRADSVRTTARVGYDDQHA